MGVHGVTDLGSTRNHMAVQSVPAPYTLYTSTPLHPFYTSLQPLRRSDATPIDQNCNAIVLD
jgi:hypothetical protein